MSAIAQQAFKKQREILGMCSSPLRFDWQRGLAENWAATMRRRRNMLTAASLHLSAQYREWDELSEPLRMAMHKALS